MFVLTNSNHVIVYITGICEDKNNGYNIGDGILITKHGIHKYEFDSIPSGVCKQQWCYNEDEGFYENTAYSDLVTTVTNISNNSVKAYLTGTTKSTTGRSSQVFDTGVYLSENPGELVANNYKGNLEGTANLTGTPTAPTADLGTNTTQIATTAFVKSEINSSILAITDTMVFKGTVSKNTDLPTEHKVGWTYKVATSGTYVGVACEVGDMIICIKDGTSANNSDWTVIQTNIDGAVIGPASSTDKRIAVFDGTTGKVIKDSGYTISKSVPSNAVFTDTHYASKNVVGSSTSKDNTTSALTNGNVYINSVENNAVTSSHKISGSGATTVTTDNKGNISINSENTTYSTMTGATSSANGKSGLVPAPTAGTEKKYLRGDGTWAYANTANVLTFTDITIPTSAFLQDSTYEDYPYRVDITNTIHDGIDKVKAYHVPYVTFTNEDATSGRYSPITSCDDGIVQIWANTVPESPLIISTIQCIRSADETVTEEDAPKEIKIIGEFSSSVKYKANSIVIYDGDLWKNISGEEVIGITPVVGSDVWKTPYPLRTKLLGALDINKTELTFTDSHILETSTIDVYTDDMLVTPIDIILDNGSLTVKFEAQTKIINVKVIVIND